MVLFPLCQRLPSRRILDIKVMVTVQNNMSNVFMFLCY